MKSAEMNGTKGKTKPKILLVVSNDLIRDVFQELFERSGYNTVAVDTAMDGFKALNDECFDIVICDFDLYDSTGVEFFETCKTFCKDKTIILMTTYGDDLDISDVKKLNIRHVLEKPFPFEKLLKIIKSISH